MAFQKPLWCGTQKFTAQEDRQYVSTNWLVEGVGSASSLAVSERSEGANFSFDVAPGWAHIEGDDAPRQGIYSSFNDLKINKPHPLGTGAAPLSDPRIDLVVARLYDTEFVNVPVGYDGDVFFIDVIQGSEHPDADDPNIRGGAPALPDTAIWLADLVMQPGMLSIQTSHIVDYRKMSGLMLFGEDGNRYRLGVDTDGDLGMEQL